MGESWPGKVNLGRHLAQPLKSLKEIVPGAPENPLKYAGAFSPGDLCFDLMSGKKNITPNLDLGLKVIQKQLKTLTGQSGVYRMADSGGNILYVGKAKNLKKRVVSYTRLKMLSTRLKKMVSLTASMEIITTHTEAEALLLEANLIKKLKPHYNILLRDDKSFPYILLRTDHPWAQITKHRGAQKKDGEYFGPFAAASAVNKTLNTLQKIFLLRSCSDSVFSARTRPCLLYQIKRCSAPCVDKITPADYARLVNDARIFLKGKKTGIQKRLAGEMKTASDAREYEKAASFRDRLQALTRIQAHQLIHAKGLGDADIIAIAGIAGATAIQVFFFRAGQNWGNRSYFPRHAREEPEGAVLGAFISQFYANKPIPKLILVNIVPESRMVMEQAFSEKSGRRVTISKPQRGRRKNLVLEAGLNALGALKRRLAENTAEKKILEKLVRIFSLEGDLERIEVYDNSHISGKYAVGAMIVAGPGGFTKNAYRKFNIRSRELSPGDAYGMMREVFTRRFSRLVKEDPDRAAGHWPDLVLIDGGKGQLSAAHDVLTEMGIGDLCLVAISKGPDRHAGREQFHIRGQASFTLPGASAELYYLQRLRDEAHRFAISAHRARRKKNIYASPLDNISGVGPGRKRALLNHFGSAAAVKEAGRKDLEAVKGISKSTAQAIYDFFHEQG